MKPVIIYNIESNSHSILLTDEYDLELYEIYDLECGYTGGILRYMFLGELK